MEAAILYVLSCVFYLHGCVRNEATSAVNLGMFEYSCTRAVMKEVDCQGLSSGQRRGILGSGWLSSPSMGTGALSLKMKWPERQVDHSTTP